MWTIRVEVAGVHAQTGKLVSDAYTTEVALSEVGSAIDMLVNSAQTDEYTVISVSVISTL